MKALVKSHAKKGIWLEDVPMPEVGNNDVLIKVQKTAICGTDIHIYNWDAWAQKTIPVPMTTGHEFAGVIAEMGQNVTDLEVGDVVSAEGHIVCGRCRNCLGGKNIYVQTRSGLVSIGQALLLNMFQSLQKMYLNQVERSLQTCWLVLTLMAMRSILRCRSTC